MIISRCDDGDGGDVVMKMVYVEVARKWKKGCPHVYNALKTFHIGSNMKMHIKVTLEKVLTKADGVQTLSHVGRV